jgi:hypothetical protein
MTTRAAVGGADGVDGIRVVVAPPRLTARVKRIGIVSEVLSR